MSDNTENTTVKKKRHRWVDTGGFKKKCRNCGCEKKINFSVTTEYFKDGMFYSYSPECDISAL